MHHCFNPACHRQIPTQDGPLCAFCVADKDNREFIRSTFGKETQAAIKAIEGKDPAEFMGKKTSTGMEKFMVSTGLTMPAGELSYDKPAVQTVAQKYPKYYKAIPKDWDSIDVYGICKLFPVKDDSGCIHHALKKLLVPGVRTGGKSFYNDIQEARDTLNRWLELNKEMNHEC